VFHFQLTSKVEGSVAAGDVRPSVLVRLPVVVKQLCTSIVSASRQVHVGFVNRATSLCELSVAAEGQGRLTVQIMLPTTHGRPASLRLTCAKPTVLACMSQACLGKL
jgi:hypothetical protein